MNYSLYITFEIYENMDYFKINLRPFSFQPKYEIKGEKILSKTLITIENLFKDKINNIINNYLKELPHKLEHKIKEKAGKYEII